MEVGQGMPIGDCNRIREGVAGEGVMKELVQGQGDPLLIGRLIEG